MSPTPGSDQRRGKGRRLWNGMGGEWRGRRKRKLALGGGVHGERGEFLRGKKGKKGMGHR